MDISALTATTYAPAAAAPRTLPAPQDSVTREGARAARQEDDQAAPNQASRAQAEALRAAREAEREQELQADAAGNIRFVEEDGTRVMKVMDRKDVLIYQVPTKGELTLIKAEEGAAKRMLARA